MITFEAEAWGYYYLWESDGRVSNDVFGQPFLVASPVKRLQPPPGERNKPGYLRSPHVWHLDVISPRQHEADFRSVLDAINNERKK